MIPVYTFVVVPVWTPLNIQEGILSCLSIWLAGIVLLAVLFLLAWRFTGKIWFWIWDRYVERQRPNLVLRNSANLAFDISMPVFGGRRFNFSRASLLISGTESWEPGLLKVRRGLTFGKEVLLTGKYRPRGEKGSIKFEISSQKKSKHKIKGLPEDFVFAVEKNAY